MTSGAAVNFPVRRLVRLALALRRHDVGRLMARTAGYNIASVAAAALGGIVVARALGPQLRGEYAAVTSWFGVMLVLGQMGQPAAVCFFVAHDPARARGYVATARALMLMTGTIVLAGGTVLAPLLSHGNAGLADAYRLAFAASTASFAGVGYLFALQARNLRLWNTTRVIQPALSLVCLIVLWRLQMLTLMSALVVLASTMVIQLVWAYGGCRSAGVAPGRAQVKFAAPLVRYGMAQIAALTPATINAYLDQLVLSQVVPPAVLGRYAIAVTCSLLPIPLVSAIGNVAFPHLASKQYVDAQARRIQWLGIVSSGCVAGTALMLLDLIAPWLIPRVFGPAYADVTPLLWALTPAGVLMACNQVAGDVLRGRKRPLAVARAEGLAAVFTVVLLILLLPSTGVSGEWPGGVAPPGSRRTRREGLPSPGSHRPT